MTTMQIVQIINMISLQVALGIDVKTNLLDTCTEARMLSSYYSRCLLRQISKDSSSVRCNSPEVVMT